MGRERDGRKGRENAALSYNLLPAFTLNVEL